MIKNQIEDKECFITLFFYFYMIMMATLIKISDNKNRDKLRKKDCYYDELLPYDDIYYNYSLYS